VNSSSDHYYLQQNLKDLLSARSLKRGDFVLASACRFGLASLATTG